VRLAGTNGFNVTFTGAGLSVGSSASLSFTNSGNSSTTFQNGSTAGQAQISITGGAVIFNDGNSADHARIAVNIGAVLQFAGSGVGNDNSSAANATITTNGIVIFQNASTPANASIEVDAAGSLQGSGSVVLDGNTPTVGGNDRTTTFNGDIGDDGLGGSLTKAGNGALTLPSFNNTYIGATTVNGGALIVDGSITFSSGVFVNAGGTLAGNGFVYTTTINDGGTLAPGHGDGTGGLLRVVGDLTFTAGAAYLVQVSSAGANQTDVLGGTAWRRHRGGELRARPPASASPSLTRRRGKRVRGNHPRSPRPSLPLRIAPSSATA
jgi:autotransporter-associated beta strand protein